MIAVAGVAAGPGGCPLSGPGYGVDVPFMLSWRRGCGIHVVSAGPGRAAGRDHRSRECRGNAGAPGVMLPAHSALARDQQKRHVRWRQRMDAASAPDGRVLMVPAGQVMVQRTICRIRPVTSDIEDP